MLRVVWVRMVVLGWSMWGVVDLWGYGNDVLGNSVREIERVVGERKRERGCEEGIRL